MKNTLCSVSLFFLVFTIFNYIIPAYVLCTPGYDITLIDAGYYTWANAINDSGDVAGRVQQYNYTGPNTGFLFKDGNIQSLGYLGGSSSSAQGINNNGQIAGFSETGSGEQHAFIYDNGIMTDLGTPNEIQSYAWGINNHGDIVGNYQTTEGVSAFLYKDGIINEIKGFNNGNSGAYDINDSGQITGFFQNDSDETHAFRIANDIILDLGDLGGGHSSGLAINKSGWVVGQSKTTEGNDHAFIYGSDNAMEDLGTLGGTHSLAWGINDLGDVVGWSWDENRSARAFLYTDSRMIDLNEYLPVDSELTLLTSAHDINEKGQITGLGLIGRNQVGFLMTPKWVAEITTEEFYLTEYLTLADTFSFDYWFKMGTEPTEFNLDILLFKGDHWEVFGGIPNFDGSSDEWATFSMMVPEWARGRETQIKFVLADWGQDTDPTVYLRNISSDPVPEPATFLLLGFGLIGLGIKRIGISTT